MATLPQLSGRGLRAHRGTLDKLESISGWRADLTTAQMHSQLESVGAVICAAGADLAPADRKMYALRDVTGDRRPIPLLASSVMSKEDRQGTGAPVLDVKTGSGAFPFVIPTTRGGWLETMVLTQHPPPGYGPPPCSTDMSTPLGLTAGNAVEVAESLGCSPAAGPADVVELTFRAGAGDAGRRRSARRRPAAHLATAGAMDTWRSMIAAWGGDLTPAAGRPTRGGGAGSVVGC